MMRLPPFRYRAARTIEEAAAWLADAPEETLLVAGGTDILPNMKRRQQTPRTLVGLRGIEALTRCEATGDALRIGAGTTLASLVGDARVARDCRALWQAAAQVATPQIRNMGTLGGNLCLDTRCHYYDQSYEWRQAIDFCMKKDGGICWVATSSPKCLAVASSDTAPALAALDARVRLASAAGERWVPVGDLYENDGIHYMVRRPEEILVEIDVPVRPGWRSSYWKLRRRGSFDFPVLGVAAALSLAPDGVVADARLVLGAAASMPLRARAAEACLIGSRLEDDAIVRAAEAAFVIAKPMDNTDFELVWRKRMSRALATAALRELRGEDVGELRMKLARQTLVPAS